MSTRVVDATGELLDAIEDGARRRIALGTVNGRYFLFHVGMGFDAAVVEQVERRPRLKRRAGHALFVYAAFATWLRHYDGSRARMTLELPGGAVDEGAFLAVCLKTNPYTYLGRRRLNLAPDAGFDRGLTLVSFRTMPMRVIVALAASTLASGRWARRHPRVGYHPDLARVVVTARGQPFPYQVDGDFVGEVDRLVLGREADALDVYFPLPRE